MPTGAELRLGRRTDIADYARWMLIAVAREGSLPGRTRAFGLAGAPSDWPQTRYEAKAISAGRRCN